MDCTFQVGDVVVCINDKYSPTFDAVHKPKLNQVLTIRAMRISESPSTKGKASLTFNEIRNPLHIPTQQEYAFVYTRFRPARKTDISCFTALLNTKELVDATR